MLNRHFLYTPTIFGVLEHSNERFCETHLSGAVRILATAGRARAFYASGRFWINADDPAAYSRAEKALLDKCGIAKPITTRFAGW